jgi:hypothetical protein
MKPDYQDAIRELLLDEKAAAFVRKLMRDVPIRDNDGKIVNNRNLSYS